MCTVPFRVDALATAPASVPRDPPVPRRTAAAVCRHRGCASQASARRVAIGGCPGQSSGSRRSSPASRRPSQSRRLRPPPRSPCPSSRGRWPTRLRGRASRPAATDRAGAHPLPARLVDRREHAEPVCVPRANHRHQLAPAQGTFSRAANEPRRRLVAHHVAQGLEVFEPWRPQEEACSLESDVVEGWHGLRSSNGPLSSAITRIRDTGIIRRRRLLLNQRHTANVASEYHQLPGSGTTGFTGMGTRTRGYQWTRGFQGVRAGTAVATIAPMQQPRYAARQLRLSPGFTLVAVLTLVLGMGANSAFFSVLYGVVLRQPPYPGADRL